MAVAIALFLLALAALAILGSGGTVFAYWDNSVICARCGRMHLMSELEVLGRRVKAGRRIEDTPVSRVLYKEQLDAAPHEYRFSTSRRMALSISEGLVRRTFEQGEPGLPEDETLRQALQVIAAGNPENARRAWSWLYQKIDALAFPTNVQQSLQSRDSETLVKLLREALETKVQ